MPLECLTDSMPGVVDRWECDEPVLNARYVDFAAYYGFAGLIAPRACPQWKAIAERYRSREDYLARVRGAAKALAVAGYLLDEDIETSLTFAARFWDAWS